MKMRMPCLLIDKGRCLWNLERMATKARGLGLELRPHFKTHQSEEVGRWFRDFGVKSITVSSFAMAERFARAGWEDILVAFPLVPGEIEALNALAAHLRMSVLIDHPLQVEALAQIRHRVEFYIDIDTGYGRTGVAAEDRETIAGLILRAGQNPLLQFRGFYCHAGHSYKAGSQEERKMIHRKAMDDLASLKEEFRQHDPLILYGDTPNCSTMEDFGDTNVLTPGNFVFYDLFQYSIASCGLEDIAVHMECPVSGVYPQRKQVLIHGGAVHFSKEGLRLYNQEIFGQLEGKPEARLISLSQEHGIIEMPPEMLNAYNPGDSVQLIPVHSCLTVNLMQGHIRII